MHIQESVYHLLAAVMLPPPPCKKKSTYVSVSACKESVGVMSIDTYTKQDNLLPIIGVKSTKSFDNPQVFAKFGNIWESSVIDVIPNVPNRTEQKTEQCKVIIKGLSPR